MIRRRNSYDPLEPAPEPRWLVIRGMTGATLSARAIPADTNLKRLFVATMLEWVDAGWELEEFGSRTGTFFCHRGVERRMVSIQPGDPHEAPPSGGSHLPESPGIGA